MLSIVHSFEMNRGDDRQLTYAVVDQQEPAVVIDITGALLEWTLDLQDPTVSEPQPIPGSTIVTKDTTGGGVVITDAVNGAFRVDLGSGDTVALAAPADYYHEVQITLGGLVTTIVRGIITLKRDSISPGP